MSDQAITPTTLTAVLVATTASLVARTMIQLELVDSGFAAEIAADLSYLIVPFILLILLFPLWRSHKTLLYSQFLRADLSWPIVIRAIAIGVLMRVCWWAQLVVGVSFGFYVSGKQDAALRPVFSFECGSPAVVLLGFFVMVFMVPLIEELTHRSFVVTMLRRRGMVVSVVVSAIVFMVLHNLGSWPFAFLAGIVFAIQYWISASLWPSLISHAVVNALIQIDWRCLSGTWVPPPSDLPLTAPGLIGLIVLVGSVVGIICLLSKSARGAIRSLRGADES